MITHLLNLLVFFIWVLHWCIFLLTSGVKCLGLAVDLLLQTLLEKIKSWTIYSSCYLHTLNATLLSQNTATYCLHPVYNIIFMYYRGLHRRYLWLWSFFGKMNSEVAIGRAQCLKKPVCQNSSKLDLISDLPTESKIYVFRIQKYYSN